MAIWRPASPEWSLRVPGRRLDVSTARDAIGDGPLTGPAELVAVLVDVQLSPAGDTAAITRAIVSRTLASGSWMSRWGYRWQPNTNCAGF